MFERLFEEFVAAHDYGDLFLSIQRSFKEITGIEPDNLEAIMTFTRDYESQKVYYKMRIFKKDWHRTIKDFKQFVEEKKSEKTALSNFQQAMEVQKKQAARAGTGLMEQIKASNVHSGYIDQKVMYMGSSGQAAYKTALEDYWSSTSSGGRTTTY